MRLILFLSLLSGLTLIGCGKDDGGDTGAGGTTDGGGTDGGTTDGGTTDGGTTDGGTTDGGTTGDTGDTGTGGGTTGDTGDTGAAAPGTLTVVGEDITGLEGKTLVFEVSISGVPTGALGAACATITSDPADFSATVSTVGPDPCAPIAALTLEPAIYLVTAESFSPGNPLPEGCGEATVELDGDTELAMPELLACPVPGGGTDGGVP